VRSHGMRSFTSGEVLIMRTIALSLSLLACSGCSLVLDDKVGGFTHDTIPDMVLSLSQFEPHVQEFTEVLLLNDQRFIQGVAVLDPLPAADVDIVLVDAVAPNVRNVDFWTEHNFDGMLTAPVPDPVTPGRLSFEDHMWRVRLGEFGRLEFAHSTDFADIVTVTPAVEVVGPLSIELTGAPDGSQAEVFVWRAEGRQVGYYLRGTIEGQAISTELRGIIDEDTTYRVEVSIDGAEPRCANVIGTTTGGVLATELAELGPCP
jgi:hypothetical protein